MIPLSVEGDGQRPDTCGPWLDEIYDLYGMPVSASYLWDADSSICCEGQGKECVNRVVAEDFRPRTAKSTGRALVEMSSPVAEDGLVKLEAAPKDDIGCVSWMVIDVLGASKSSATDGTRWPYGVVTAAMSRSSSACAFSRCAPESKRMAANSRRAASITCCTPSAVIIPRA